jgi:plastocyanin
MTRKLLLSLATALFLFATVPAWATIHIVTVSDFQFSPSTVTVTVGDTVEWNNVQGTHNVHHLGTPSLFGNALAPAPWTYRFAFNLPTGTYDYDCTLHGFIGHVIVEPLSAPDPSATGPVGQFALAQNYPNPFNPSTTIQFSVPFDGNVTLTVYNVLGEEVRQLYAGHASPGTYNVNFNGADLPSGLYFYRLQTPSATLVRTMQYLK